MKDLEYYNGATKSFITIYFPPGKNGETIGKPLKTPKGALKRGYEIMKKKKVGSVNIRFEVEWSNGPSTSAPYGKITNSERGKCIYIHGWAGKKPKKYYLLKDGRLERIA